MRTQKARKNAGLRNEQGADVSAGMSIPQSRGYSAAAILLAFSLLLPACRGAAEQPAGGATKSAASASSGATGQVAKQVFKFSHVVAKNTPKGKATEKFAELVKQKSNGAIEIQVFANAELYKDAEELEGLQTNAVQFLAPGTDKLGVLVPAWEAPSLPYIFPNVEAANRFIEPGNPIAVEMYERLRLKSMLGLAIWLNGWKAFSDSKRPLKLPADFKGLKFRASGKPDEALIKAFGGSAQVMAFSEVFGALQQGVVDGQINTWSNIYTQKFHEIQKYATISGSTAFLTYAVITNAKWWDGLDPGTRKILSDAMTEATAYGNGIAKKENDDSLEAVKATKRLDIYTLNKDEDAQWKQAALVVTREAEPRVGKDVVEKLQALGK